MSGGGGGGYSSPVGASTSCNIVERVPLSSPKAGAATLRVSDELDVTTINNGTTLIALDKTGANVGSLMPKALLAILKCISTGHDYKAVKVQGGMIEVEIRPK